MSVDSTPSSKNTVWQTGLRSKSQQPVVYKRPNLWTETNTCKGERLEENLPNEWPLKQAEVAIFI
jgi:hypothetical protein